LSFIFRLLAGRAQTIYTDAGLQHLNLELLFQFSLEEIDQRRLKRDDLAAPTAGEMVNLGIRFVDFAFVIAGDITLVDQPGGFQGCQSPVNSGQTDGVISLPRPLVQRIGIQAFGGGSENFDDKLSLGRHPSACIVNGLGRLFQK